MKNRYVPMSVLLLGLSLDCASQPSTAQRLSLAHTRFDDLNKDQTTNALRLSHSLTSLNSPTSRQRQAVVKRITGQVLDENNAGLPGVSIIEKGTQNGTTTDASGNFTLNVGDTATTLTVSSVGYTDAGCGYYKRHHCQR